MRNWHQQLDSGQDAQVMEYEILLELQLYVATINGLKLRSAENCAQLWDLVSSHMHACTLCSPAQILRCAYLLFCLWQGVLILNCYALHSDFSPLISFTFHFTYTADTHIPYPTSRGCTGPSYMVLWYFNWDIYSFTCQCGRHGWESSLLLLTPSVAQMVQSSIYV
jgi:hypothetical protein